MVDQPGHCRPPIGLRVLGGAFGRVGAQQVVHAVPAGAGRLNEVGTREYRKQPAAGGQVDVGQRGCRVVVAVVSGVQPQQAEHPCRGGVKAPIRPGEHRPYRGPVVRVSVEQVQPGALVGQLGHQLCEGYRRPGSGQFGADAQGQR